MTKTFKKKYIVNMLSVIFHLSFAVRVHEQDT